MRKSSPQAGEAAWHRAEAIPDQVTQTHGLRGMARETQWYAAQRAAWGEATTSTTLGQSCGVAGQPQPESDRSSSEGVAEDP